MKYLKQLIKVLMYPFIFLIGEFIIQFIFVYHFNQTQIRLLKHKYISLSNTQIMNKFNNLLKTTEYKVKLNDYINNHALLIIIIIGIIFIPIGYLFYKRYRDNYNSNLKCKNIPMIILFGVCISLIFNLTMSNVNYVYHFTDNYALSSIPIWIQIISSGIIGPIMEELLFRGIGYNQLKKFNKPMKAIIMSSIIFAIFHFSNNLNVIYSFMMSFLFIYVYEKYQTIKAPMLLHVSANITTILSMLFIVKNNIWINLLVLLWSLSIILILYFYVIRLDHFNWKK